MLIEFSVRNFLSFKDTATLSMVAANSIKEYQNENLIFTERYKLLKSAIIYGANASGKSNLLSALRFMRWFVINSFKDTQVDEKISIVPFKLSTETLNKPAFFEIVFLMNNRKYRYGFEADQDAVQAEWLFMARKNKEQPLFLRQADGIKVADLFKEGDGLEAKTRDNALFLSVVAQFNGEISKLIINWFRNMNQISGLLDQDYEVTVSLLDNEEYKKKIVKFMKIADLGIDDVRIESPKIPPENLSSRNPYQRALLINRIINNLEGKFDRVKSKHKAFDANRNEIKILEEFDFDEEESEGTKKFFRLAGPVFDALSNGKILVIDEFETRLHFRLSQAIVQLFNSSSANKKNAQLIFATHDTHLLSAGIFRRDQVWFTEKDHFSATNLYSLAEYKIPSKKVRNDAAFEKDYIKGRYGAVPLIGDFEAVLREEVWQEK